MTRIATADLITVPAGSKPVECTRCRDTVYWAKSDSGRWILVDCSPPGCEEPSESADTRQLGIFGSAGRVRDGMGISHFISCPPGDGR